MITSNDVFTELSCPITLDLFKDPCCGKAFSREALKQHLSRNQKNCPLCNGVLMKFDVDKAPRNMTIVGLINTLSAMKKKKSEIIKVTKNTKKELNWKCKIEQVQNFDEQNCEVGELKVSLHYKGYTSNPSIVIVICDRSGSMSGTPWKQVQMALLDIIKRTGNNNNIKTFIVPYDSTAYILNGDDIDIVRKIQETTTGGSTHFSEGFKKAGEVMRMFNYPENASNVVTIFLTDGQDNSGEKIADLPKIFKDIIKDSWKGPFNVHSVGFSKDHNFDFLENLRKIGTSEGFYRYAEIEDDGDTLCGKLTAIFNIVSSYSSIPIEMELPKTYSFYKGKENLIQFPLNEKGFGSITKWINIKKNVGKFDPKKPPVVSFKKKKIEIPIQIVEPSINTRKVLFQRWISNLVDELASDVLDLCSIDSKKYGKNVFELHCALLIQRGNAIKKNIGSDKSSTVIGDRMTNLLTNLKNLRDGKQVRKEKLNDLRFESQFGTPKPVKVTKKTIKKERKVSSFFPSGGEIRLGKSGRSKLHKILAGGSNVEVTSSLENATLDELKELDDSGNSVLCLAVNRGNINAINKIISRIKAENFVNLPNKDGHTCLSLAINPYGHWRTSKVIYDLGGKIPRGKEESLLYYVLRRGFFNTAKFMIQNGLVLLDKLSEELKNSLSDSELEWLNTQEGSNINIDISTAISKGMIEAMKKCLLTGTKPKIEMLYDACVKKSPNHVEIARILIASGLNLNEISKTSLTGASPLFHASQIGSVEHVRLFIKYGANVNYQTMKGNTPLWIACCKKNEDCVTELINCKADPNHKNKKGDTALITCCQRGYVDIALLLIASGININSVNVNGDTPVLICCRTGQVEMLKLLLEHAGDEALKYCLHVPKIDGFSSLFAATEADKPECIELLLKYGVGLEQKTAKDNQIIAASTPLHLSAYYNCYEAAKTLLKNGANPNSIDMDGSTPMHVAVKKEHVEIVSLLRSYKADIFQKDIRGNQPSYYCRENDKVLNILRDPAYRILMKLARRGFSEEEEKIACELLKKFAGVSGCLSKKHSVDVFMGNCVTPLIESVIHSTVLVVKTLLEIGADPNMKDLRGLNSFVWAQWANSNEVKKLLVKDYGFNTQLYSERLKFFSSKDIRNAVILYPRGKKINFCYDEIKSHSGISDRMNSFIEATLSKTEFKLKEMNTSASIINLFDGVRNISKSKPNANIIQTLIWKAKIFVAGIVMEGSMKLDPQDLLAIYLFVSNTRISLIINDVIVSSGNDIQEMNDKINQYVLYLINALKKLPDFMGVAYRGVNCKFDRSLYKIGKTINWITFSSATTDWGIAGTFKNKKGTVFIIKSKTGKLLKGFSKDNEIVFLPGTKFRVTNWYRGGIIALGQENIRKTAYKLSKEDIEKMEITNDGLIIEMEEV